MQVTPLIAAFGLALTAAGTALANPNLPPPVGAILDLGGGETGTPAQPINLVVQTTGSVIPGAAPVLESVDFVASLTDTDIALAFRDDPAGILFWNVSLTDLTNPGGNVLLNGNFTGGVYASNGLANTPIDWTFSNPSGGVPGGGVISGCGAFTGLSTDCFAGGNGGVYQTISQFVATHPGDQYALSFYYGAALGSNGLGAGNGFLSDLSTTGTTSVDDGNGIDLLAYAGAADPAVCASSSVCVNPVPLSPSLGFLGFGFVGFALLMRRRRLA